MVRSGRFAFRGTSPSKQVRGKFFEAAEKAHSLLGGLDAAFHLSICRLGLHSNLAASSCNFVLGV